MLLGVFKMIIKMNVNKLLIAAFLITFALTSCFKEEDTTPDFLKLSRNFGGEKLDYGKRITRTADGGYLLVGDTESFTSGEKDVYVVKIDAEGTKLWEKTYGGAGTEEVRDILRHPDGNFYICGYTTSKGSGGADMMLLKISSSGEQAFVKTYGELYYDMAFSVELSAENNLMLGGYVTDLNSQTEHLNVREVNTDGGEIWSSTFENDTAEMVLSGINVDDGYLYSGKAVLSDDNEDIIFFKIDFQGNMLWKKRYGGAGVEQAPDIAETPEGDFILSGFSGSFYENRNNDLYLLKVSANGDSITSSHYGQSETWDFEEGYSIIRSTQGDYFVSGRSKDAILIARVNAALEVTHTAVYGKEFLEYTAIGYDMFEKPDQSIAVIGGQPFSQEGDMMYIEIEPDAMEEVVLDE